MDEDDSTKITIGSSRKKSISKKKKEKVNKQDNFITMGVEGAKELPWKSYLMLCIIILVVLCDVFTDRVLTGFSDAVDGTEPTSKGTVIQMLFIVIIYAIVDFMTKTGYF